MAYEVAEEVFALAKSNPQALKREPIFSDLRGPKGVQFHDIPYKSLRDILYTRTAGIAVGVAVLGLGGMGSSSQIRVRR